MRATADGIGALFVELGEALERVVGDDLPVDERRRAVATVRTAVRIFEIVVIDLNRIADAAEILAHEAAK
jgi:hypothetical protein